MIDVIIYLCLKKLHLLEISKAVYISEKYSDRIDSSFKYHNDLKSQQQSSWYDEDKDLLL